MTNGSKFKTAQERAKAFRIFCGGGQCGKCQFQGDHYINKERCRFLWLDLEAEDENPETVEDVVKEMLAWPSAIDTEDANYLAERILAAHNSVAKNCQEAKE